MHSMSFQVKIESNVSSKVKVPASKGSLERTI
jgi:hypothetical protein